MANPVIARAAEQVARQNRRRTSRLRLQAERRAQELREDHAREQERQLAREAGCFARIAERANRACRGLENLRELGRSREVQELIRTQKGPIVLWGDVETTTPGYDMIDIHWRWVTLVTLSKTEVRAQNYVETSSDHGQTFRRHLVDRPIDFRFPYDAQDAFRQQFMLWRIAEESSIGSIAEIEERNDWNERHSPDALFEVFIECATKGGLEGLFLRAINMERRHE